MLYASRPRVFCSFVQISAGPLPATPPLSQSHLFFTIYLFIFHSKIRCNFKHIFFGGSGLKDANSRRVLYRNSFEGHDLSLCVFCSLSRGFLG